MELDAARVRAIVEAVVRSEAELSESVARDVAFHMTDWLSDLEKYYEFCANPGRLSPAEVERLLLDFLVHVPNHVAAASKLLAGLPVTDIFGVGATSDDQDDAG